MVLGDPVDHESLFPPPDITLDNQCHTLERPLLEVEIALDFSTQLAGPWACSITSRVYYILTCCVVDLFQDRFSDSMIRN